MTQRGPTNYHAFVEMGEIFVQKFAYDSSGNAIYTGWTEPGNLTSDPYWRIKKQKFDVNNRVTDVQWPNFSPSFNFSWDLRTTYNYGDGAGAQIYPAYILSSSDGTRWACSVLTNGATDSVPTLSGPAGAYDTGSLVLQDSNGIYWNITILNTGNINSVAGGDPTAGLSSISIIDTNSRIWVVTASVTGDLITS